MNIHILTAKRQPATQYTCDAGYEVTSLTQFTTETNFDVLDPNNELYKYNSTEGGAIMPRGTSIIGLDLRKTKLRPLYVPDSRL